MKKSDFGIEIIKGKNGFVIEDNEGNLSVAEEEENDELSAIEKLFWEILDFFEIYGCKHDKERISVIREAGDDYVLSEDGKER